MCHIVTDESFLVDAIVLENSECLICQQTSDMRAGYVFVKCDKCGCMYDPSEMWMGHVVRMRRGLLNLSRKQMSKLVNLSPKTIKHYEFVKCSKKYYEFTATYILTKPPTIK